MERGRNKQTEKKKHHTYTHNTGFLPLWESGHHASSENSTEINQIELSLTQQQFRDCHLLSLLHSGKPVCFTLSLWDADLCLAEREHMPSTSHRCFNEEISGKCEQGPCSRKQLKLSCNRKALQSPLFHSNLLGEVRQGQDEREVILFKKMTSKIKA